MKKTIILFSALIGLILSSCMSMQHEIALEAQDIQDDGFSMDMESRIAVIDAKVLLDPSYAQTSEFKSAQNFIITTIDEKLASSQFEKSVETKLIALKGHAYICGGNKNEAKKNLKNAEDKFFSDTQVAILRRRLGIASYSENSAVYKNNPYITLEAAIESFEKGQFEMAAGLCDTAFLSLPEYYKTAYEALRNKSWELKDSSIAESSLNQITVIQMINFTQKNGNLVNIINEKKNSSKAIYKAVNNAKFLSPKSAAEESVEIIPDENSLVTRIIAARFLWNVFCYEKGESFNGTKYSSKYRSRENAKSPVADVDILSSDFDAVLGCVENEILSLPNGKNFYPDEHITGADFSKGLKNLQK